LFFVASDPTAGQEFWKTDGTAVGTVRVKDIVPRAGGSSAFSLVAVNATLFVLTKKLLYEAAKRR
jgi:large repetitive protein